MAAITPGTRVKLLADMPYDNVTIPADTLGTVEDNDGDLYFALMVSFDGFEGSYIVGVQDVEAQQ